MNRLRPAGFTLIEMVIVITLLGILAASSAVVLRGPIASYFDTVRRTDLAQSGEMAWSKLRQEVAQAVPNSVRTANAGGRFWLEFLPTRSEGRYRAAGPGDVLTFGAPDTGFDVLGPPVTAQPGDWVVVNNHLPLTSVWAGTSRAAYAGGAGTVATIAHAAHMFTADAADRRFQIAANPVSYVCDPVAGSLARVSNYGIPAPVQPTVFGPGAQTDVLATGVQNCRAAAFAGSLRAAQVVAVDIGLSSNGDRLALVQTIRVGPMP